jgi:hypothetical protein
MVTYIYCSIELTAGMLILINIETSERDNQYRKHTPDAVQVESAQSISSESAPKVEETSIHLRWRRLLGGRKGK